jgi:hypothetical protein
MRVVRILVVASTLVAGACGGASSDSPGADDVSVVGSLSATSTPVTTLVDDGVSTSPTSGELEAIVTASGRGPLIDSVGIVDLEVVGGSGADEPWLRFGLSLNYCCSEPNSLIFPSDQWAVDVAGAPLRIDGPQCEEPVECSDSERRVVFVPFEPAVVQFEVFRVPDGESELSPGTYTGAISPTFHWVGDAMDPEAVNITLRFDITAPVPPLSGDTTPTMTPHQSVTVVGGGLDLLPFPFAGVANDAGELTAMTSTSASPIDVENLAIDWQSQAALVVSIGSDLCPPLLEDIDVTDGVGTPVFVGAGYLMCEEPLVPYTVIAAVDRQTLEGVLQLVLPARLTATGQDTVTEVAVTPSSGELIVEPIVADFGERSGVVPLPARGEVAAGVLDDGTPVFVVSHHDGTVSALDPRGDDQRVAGLYQVVRWVAATRNFLGHGAWDEYGRRLDGFRTSDLRGYATRVVDGNVEIGSPVAAPSGSPITTTDAPPAMADLDIPHQSLLGLDAATDLAPGMTAWIDALVYALPVGAHVCTDPGSVTTVPPVTTAPAGVGCPAGSPVANGIAGTPGYVTYYVGPLLATRTEDGFERIASTGGYGGTTL